MEKLLVDTNIVIDLLSRREEFYREAQELFTLADNHEVELFVSAITFADTHYLLPKIRKSIILGKAGIFRQTFKLPFSRFHAVFSQCIRLFTKMCLLFANLRAEKEIFHPIFNVKTYFTLSRLLIQLITGRYSG